MIRTGMALLWRGCLAALALNVALPACVRAEEPPGDQRTVELRLEALQNQAGKADTADTKMAHPASITSTQWNPAWCAWA